jgi:putative membrane protein
MIPNMLSDKCKLDFNGTSALSVLLMILGFLVSFYLGDIQGNNALLESIFKREKGRE